MAVRPPVPGGIRTPNLLIRSQKLYPVELQAQREFSIFDFRFSTYDKPTIGNRKSKIENCWPGGRRDSNPQQPEPQSGALPLSYGHHHWRGTKILKFESLFANKGLDFPRSLQ
jgi:hypothetical protein